MGPMLAAQVLSLIDPMRVASVTVDLYGSLSVTGRGYKTDEAVICGLAGFCADTVTADDINDTLLLADKGNTAGFQKSDIFPT